jgi:hypothetical protein
MLLTQCLCTHRDVLCGVYKSPGSDQILAQLIQVGGATCFEIYRLIGCIWNKEELPQQWKKCIILPIYRVMKL